MITAHIDMRTDHGAIRHQGARQTCLAFTLSDLNGNRHGHPSALSPEYLFREAALRTPGWKSGEGLDLHATLQAVASPGQPLERDCPYQDVEPQLPLTSFAPCSPMFRGAYGAFNPLSAQITHALGQGASVGLVLQVTPEFLCPDKDNGEVAFSLAYMFGHAHAVLAVGLGHHIDTAETHFLIRNSWGEDWGQGGHAWLPESYVTAHGLRAFGV